LQQTKFAALIERRKRIEVIADDEEEMSALVCLRPESEH
jgi:hypothetical protein